LGLSALRSMLSLLDSLVRPEPLSQQQVALNAPQAQSDLIDLAFQLTGVLQLVAWAALAGYLLLRAGIGWRQIGLDRSQPGRDAAGAAGLALLIGVPGIALYLLSYAAGLSLAVLPSTLGESWWRVPVLVLAAVGNAGAEEVIVVGYLLTRLGQLGWAPNRAVLVSALLRGVYHLYQGFGGFVGNVLLGLVFGRVWQRTGRLWMLVGAHALLDVVAFVGYALLRGRVGWLP
ncbi:MAG: CPBP family intramembrane glutamic endopeptidase, partial [Pseudonocardiaceae bacterium]